MKPIIACVVFLALVAVVAASGAQFRPGAWYLALAKPSWTPPGWLFAPVWTTLYLMIAVAGWLVWQSSGSVMDRRNALIAWGVQLVLNGAWSYLMFGQHQIALALVDIVLMWVTIAAFVALAWRPSRLAALLFTPYLAWVSLATALNATIWRLNP